MIHFDKIVYWNELNKYERKSILSRPIVKIDNDIKKIVVKIIQNVKDFGDTYIKKYNLLFDKFDSPILQVPEKKIRSSALYIKNEFKNAIEIAKKNIECFHLAQQSPEVDVETQDGVRCQQIYLPLNSIGIYIPNGIAPLFSTALMLGVPAKISGCKEIVLCSPPPISKELLYVSNLCGIDKIFQIGGAQAISALAFGTKSVPKVDKIFGPGNIYVTEAKKQVSSMLDGPSIDMLAGPSELLIIADEFSNADFIAADLLSQAEHGILSQVILVTPCYLLAKKVISSICQQLQLLKKSSEILMSLKNSIIIIAKDLFESVEISNIYAPEHLSIQTKEPRSLLPFILNASSIFLGSWSPESAGDYASGTNHVLPTYGKSISDSALGLHDFQKRILIQELTSQGLLKLSPVLKTLSSYEQLEAHKNAVKIRLECLKGLHK